MKRPCRKSRKHSFTLVEMVVAMAILVVVATIIGTASAAFYNGWQRAVKYTEKLKTSQAIDRMMDQCVRNLIPFKWRDENNSERFVFEGDYDSLHFTTLRRSLPGDRGALLFIRLRLEDGNLIAEYSEYPRLPWEEEGSQEYTREVLAGNVKSISFLYAEKNSDDEIEFLDLWEEDYHEAVPLAIQLTVEWNDGSTERWLRRTAGASANSTYGRRQTPTFGD